jgi:hypothetical protein
VEVTDYGDFSKLHPGLYHALPNQACTLGKLNMSVCSLGRISTTPVEMLLNTLAVMGPVFSLFFLCKQLRPFLAIPLCLYSARVLEENNLSKASENRNNSSS